MTENTKRQKMTEQPKYLYLAAMHPTSFYPSEKDFDAMVAIWENSSNDLFERLFQTEGYQLKFQGMNHVMVGGIYGPFNRSTLKAMLNVAKKAGNHFQMHAVDFSPDKYKIRPDFKTDVFTSCEEETTLTYKIHNVN